MDFREAIYFSEYDKNLNKIVISPKFDKATMKNDLGEYNVRIILVDNN